MPYIVLYWINILSSVGTLVFTRKKRRQGTNSKLWSWKTGEFTWKRCVSFAREVRMQNLVSFATEIWNRNLDGNPWWGMQNLFSSVITEIWNKSLDGNLWREDAKSSQLCTNLLWKHSLTTFPIQNKSGFVGLFYGQTVSLNKCMFWNKNHFTL